jgi:hypothetical protein
LTMTNKMNGKNSRCSQRLPGHNSTIARPKSGLDPSGFTYLAPAKNFRDELPAEHRFS